MSACYGDIDVPVGVGNHAGPGSGYRVVVYMPNKAMTITSTSVFAAVVPEVMWTLLNVYNICPNCIANVRLSIHREDV